MIVSFLATLTVSTALNVKPCTISSGCGACYNSGQAGRVVKDGKYQDCVPCNLVGQDKTIATVDVPPERGGGHGTTRLIADYTPPSTIGGPGRTGGSGTRLM